MPGSSRILLLLLAGTLNFSAASGKETIIRGGDPSYAGSSIRLFIGDNPYLDIPLWSEVVQCNRKGQFEVRLDLDEDVFLQISTVANLASLYVKAGEDYELHLPPDPELSYQELTSPFFSPAEIYLSPEGHPGDINHNLLRFERMFNDLNSKVVMDRMNRITIDTDSLAGILDTAFISGTFPWLDRYRQYKTGILVLNAGNTGLEEISSRYLGQEVITDHPAYMELFSVMFRDFLIYYDKTDNGRGILKQINRSHNLDSLRQQVMRHPAIRSRIMCDLLLMQELPTLFYGGTFHKEAILTLLDSLENDPSAVNFGRYAREIRERLASLLPGNIPPDFQLMSTDGKNCELKDFRGKYTYLMFCTPDHYGCMMEYPFLESYMKKHSEYLNNVCIMVAEEEELMKDFMERNSYSFTSLFYGKNRSLLEHYNVKAFPVAYLLDPEGKVILSPAPLPSDRFETVLFRIMRSRGDI